MILSIKCCSQKSLFANSLERQTHTRQGGFTLIELMVGLLISVFVGGVAMTYMVSSSRMLTNQNSEDLIQESARFAFEIMSSTARLASSNTSTHPSARTEGVTTSPQCAGADCNTDSLGYSVGGNVIDSDRFAVDYITSTGTTCTGDVIDREFKLLTVFFVDDIDGDGIPSLYCQSYRAEFDTIAQDYTTYTAGDALPLIDGVDALQVQYGVDTNDNGTIDRYSTYANIAAAEIPSVRSLRLGLLIGSGQSIATEQNTLERVQRTYQLFESSVVKEDGVLRRLFTTTVYIPNMSS